MSCSIRGWCVVMALAVACVAVMGCASFETSPSAPMTSQAAVERAVGQASATTVLIPTRTATRPLPVTDLPTATRAEVAMGLLSTSTPTWTPTRTPIPSPTPSPIPPSNTPTPTLIPPTHTHTPTSTASPLPSLTVPPPSRTPAPAVTLTSPAPTESSGSHRYVPAGPAQADPSFPCPGCPRAHAYIVGHVSDAAGKPLAGVRLVCYNDWHRYPIVASKGGGEYDFAIIQADTTWFVVVVDQADRPISPEVAVRFNPQETCRYILDWRRVE